MSTVILRTRKSRNISFNCTVNTDIFFRLVPFPTDPPDKWDVLGDKKKKRNKTNKKKSVTKEVTQL